MAQYVIGVDYGTDSARAVVVDSADGRILGKSVSLYPRWKKGLNCDARLNQWRQHPLDNLEVLESSVKDALSQCPSDVNRIRYDGLDPLFHRQGRNPAGHASGVR